MKTQRLFIALYLFWELSVVLVHLIIRPAHRSRPNTIIVLPEIRSVPRLLSRTRTLQRAAHRHLKNKHQKKQNG